jgi:hypothetical protein
MFRHALNRDDISARSGTNDCERSYRELAKSRSCKIMARGEAHGDNLKVQFPND